MDHQFYADGTKVYDSGVVTNSMPTVQASVNVTGAQVLQLPSRARLRRGTNDLRH